MAKTRLPYAPEFRRQMVELVNAGRSPEELAREFEPTETVVCSATPAGTVARTVHFGPYNRLRAAHNAVRAWCKQNQRETPLPFWEIYGDWSDDPAKLRTEVLYLLK